MASRMDLPTELKNAPVRSEAGLPVAGLFVVCCLVGWLPVVGEVYADRALHGFEIPMKL